MSLVAFQRALVELTLVPQKARSLRGGDSTVLDEFELTTRERTRLTDVVHQPGISVNCTLSRGNRFEVIFTFFPMTAVLLKPGLRDLMDEIWGASRPTNYQLMGEEQAFIAVVSRKIAAGELSAPYLAEVFAYELACMELTLRASSQPGTCPEMEMVFQHPPDELLGPLGELKMPPPKLRSGTYRARVRLVGEQFQVVEVVGLPT